MLSPEHMVTGDFDGNGVDDLAMDFGPGIGLYLRKNLTQWVFLHSSTSEGFASGDLDGSGQDEVVVDFGPGSGIYAWQNDTAWSFINNRSERGRAGRAPRRSRSGPGGPPSNGPGARARACRPPSLRSYLERRADTMAAAAQHVRS